MSPVDTAICAEEKSNCSRVLLENLKTTKIESLKWSCKMKAVADRRINLMLLVTFLCGNVPVFIVLNGMWDRFPKDIEYFYAFCGAMYFFLWLLSLMVRQKTVYNYVINEDKGECESYLYYPQWAGGFFNAVAIFVLLFFFGAAVLMGSFLPLMGAGALGIGYAGRLLGWKNEVHHKESLPWEDHNYVTIDRKRKIVVVHYTCLSNGFEVRFPDHELLERFLCFLRQALPSTAEFLERHWDPYDYRNG